MTKEELPVITIHFGDNLDVLKDIGSRSARLIYIDPPFNTGKVQARTRTRKTRDENGSHVGFGGNRYATQNLGTMAFLDSFDDFCQFLAPRLLEAQRILTTDGSLFLHLDSHECHYAKVMCDSIFGRESFKNEIVWAYDYGGRGKDRWPAKHDTILWYAINPDSYVYRYDDIDRIPYMAPGLVTPEKAARGKVPTDVWWQTIVPTNGKERTGYPTQKPIAILRRIVAVHSDPGDLVVDFFAGSGTTGEAAAQLGRSALLVDNNPEALTVMEKRLSPFNPIFANWTPQPSAPGQLPFAFA